MSTSAHSFIILDSVDSTNNYAMAQFHAGLAKQGDAFFSPVQTAGKGQRGKTWQTGTTQNIALSIVLEPIFLSGRQQFYLSASIALACFDFFAQYAGEETSIKWPNDIYWRDRKAGGILIENLVSGKTWKCSIAGIGININQENFDESLKNPVSLKQATGKNFDPVELARVLHQKVLERFNELKPENFDTILQEYNDHLFKLNTTIRLKKNDTTFATWLKGVSHEGQLITFDTKETRFNFGEVEWIL